MSGSEPSRPVQMIVLAEEGLTAQEVEAHLTADGRVRVLPADAEEEPDLLLVITAELREATLTPLRRCCPEDPAETPRPVLVPGKPDAEQLVRVVGLGAVAVMPRRPTTLADITEMLRAVVRDTTSVPRSPSGAPQEQIGTRRRKDQSADPDDASPSFTARELAVLRQLAAGSSTRDIASALHYSERTVKYIIRDMTARHRLRNRVHVVAYALRQGLL